MGKSVKTGELVFGFFCKSVEARCGMSGERKKRITPRQGRGRRPFRREEGDAGRGWHPMFTVYVTATRDNFSRYFLYSNDSNGARMGRKLIRGRGDGREFGAGKWCLCKARVRLVAPEGSETKTRILNAGGCCGTRQKNTEKDLPFQQPTRKGGPPQQKKTKSEQSQ